MKATIIYASMTGNTEEIAELVSAELEKLDVDTKMLEITESSITDFVEADMNIVATYTYGQGEVPDEAQDFYEELQNTNLKGKIYGCIGSGDTSYDDLFCKAVELFDEAFKKSGAKKGAENVKIEFQPNDNDKVKIKKFAESLFNFE